jgi:hypothetical protein
MAMLPGYAGVNDLTSYMIGVDRGWKDVEQFAVRFARLDGDFQLDNDLTELHEGHFPLDLLN